MTIIEIINKLNETTEISAIERDALVSSGSDQTKELNKAEKAAAIKAITDLVPADRELHDNDALVPALTAFLADRGYIRTKFPTKPNSEGVWELGESTGVFTFEDVDKAYRATVKKGTIYQHKDYDDKFNDLCKAIFAYKTASVTGEKAPSVNALTARFQAVIDAMFPAVMGIKAYKQDVREFAEDAFKTAKDTGKPSIEKEMQNNRGIKAMFIRYVAMIHSGEHVKVTADKNKGVASKDKQTKKAEEQEKATIKAEANV